MITGRGLIVRVSKDLSQGVAPRSAYCLLAAFALLFYRLGQYGRLRANLFLAQSPRLLPWRFILTILSYDLARVYRSHAPIKRAALKSYGTPSINSIVHV